jgi:hypothetical protein
LQIRHSAEVQDCYLSCLWFLSYHVTCYTLMSTVEAATSSVCSTWSLQMRANFWTVRGVLCRSSPSEHHQTRVSDSAFQLESRASSGHTMSGSPSKLQHKEHNFQQTGRYTSPSIIRIN